MRVEPPEYTTADYDDMLETQRKNVNTVLESINEQSEPWNDEFDSNELNNLISDMMGYIKELEHIKDIMQELEFERGGIICH